MISTVVKGVFQEDPAIIEFIDIYRPKKGKNHGCFIMAVSMKHP